MDRSIWATAWLNSTTLQQNRDAVAGWGNALTENGDMLLYGCNVAADSDGQRLLETISDITGADVAASRSSNTGHPSLSGDWELEYTKGKSKRASRSVRSCSKIGATC